MGGGVLNQATKIKRALTISTEKEETKLTVVNLPKPIPGKFPSHSTANLQKSVKHVRILHQPPTKKHAHVPYQPHTEKTCSHSTAIPQREKHAHSTPNPTPGNHERVPHLELYLTVTHAFLT